MTNKKNNKKGISGSFKVVCQTLRSTLQEHFPQEYFRVVSYHDNRHLRIGYCNTEFSFMIGASFEI